MDAAYPKPMTLGKTLERVFYGENTSMKTKASGPLSALRLQNMFYNDQEKNDTRSRGCFHPSGLTHCRRMQQLDLIYAPKRATQVPGIIRRIWHNGHNREVGLVEALSYGAAKIGGHFEPKVRISIPELYLAGETDGILYLPEDVDVIVDMKTIGSKWFKDLVALPVQYKWQFTAYMKATGIPQTICLYESKDTCNPREFFYRFNEVTWQKILKNVIHKVLNATKAEKLVSMQHEVDRGRCIERQCAYYDICTSKPKFTDADHRTEKQRRRFLAVVK